MSEKKIKALRKKYKDSVFASFTGTPEEVTKHIIETDFNKTEWRRIKKSQKYGVKRY